jgi:hypothetical protein
MGSNVGYSSKSREILQLPGDFFFGGIEELTATVNASMGVFEPIFWYKNQEDSGKISPLFRLHQKRKKKKKKRTNSVESSAPSCLFQ